VTWTRQERGIDGFVAVCSCVCVYDTGCVCQCSEERVARQLASLRCHRRFFPGNFADLVCSSSCAPQAIRRMTRYVAVCLLYEPVTITHSLLLTTRLLRHSFVPWNAFQFDTQDKGGHSSTKGFQVSCDHETRCAHAPNTYKLFLRLRARHGDHRAPVQRLEGRALVAPSRVHKEEDSPVIHAPARAKPRGMLAPCTGFACM
jgi:hypothetical protein